MSRRAYARHRGCSHVAVLKALEAGRITLEPDGTIDPEWADREWAENTDPNRRPADASKGAHGTAGLAAEPDPAPTCDNPDVDALVARLVWEAAATPRWDCELDSPPYTAAEAMAAVASVVNAKEWLFYCWLQAGGRCPDRRARTDPRREAIADALDFIVLLHRTAGPGERRRRVRAAEDTGRRFEAAWPGLKSRIRGVLALAETGGTDAVGDLVAAVVGAPPASP